jgi:hypothetical protein
MQDQSSPDAQSAPASDSAESSASPPRDWSKAKRKHTRQIGIRTTHAAYAELSARAAYANTSIPAFMLHVSLTGKWPRAPRLPVLDRELLASGLRQFGRGMGDINKLGGLLNQLARVANAGGLLECVREVATATAQVGPLAQEIMDVVILIKAILKAELRGGGE